MNHKIKLVFFEDQANGEFGLAHHNATEETNGGDAFNAFWDGRGIFHDIFEHWFEGEHEYFKDDFGFNLGGEMSAMGASMYYYYILGVNNRPYRQSMYSYAESCRLTTQDEMHEYIQEGYVRYGRTLECGVPYQKPTECHDLECYVIDEMYHEFKQMRVTTEYEQEREDGKTYKASVTKSKIQRLHRWGYHMAENLVPDNYENLATLQNFISFWDEFCKKNDASEMHDHFKGITFEVTKNEVDEIQWSATLEARDYQAEDYEITSATNYIPHIDDILCEVYAYEMDEAA